jgi:hypothetical protein
VKAPLWSLRACAALFFAYGCAWGYIAALGFIGAQQQLPAGGNPGVYGLAFVAIVFGVLMCPLLLITAVVLWRASVVGVALALVTSAMAALPLVFMLGSAVLFTLMHPSPQYRDFILGDIGLLILGPGLVIALLFVPSSRRAWRTPPA